MMSECETLIIDSLTTLDYWLIQYVMQEQRTTEMRIQDWVPFRRLFLSFVTGLRQYNKLLLVLAHEERELGKTGALLKLRVAMSSKLTDYFGGFFSDCWRCYAQPGVANESPQFFVRTQVDGFADLKSSQALKPVYEVTNGAGPLLMAAGFVSQSTNQQTTNK